MDIEHMEDEIPKHKRKKGKSVKKSKHKHIYEFQRIKIPFLIFGRTDDKTYWLSLIYKCSICGKEREEMKFANKEEYLKIKEEDELKNGKE